jgi:hypothetical protein
MRVEGRSRAGATTCALEVIVFDMDSSLWGSGLAVIHVVCDYGRRFQSVTMTDRPCVCVSRCMSF